MSLSGLFRITRPANSIAAGTAAVVAYFIATGTLVWVVTLLFAVVLLVTAAGNVINDVYDVEIDRVNRPDRPIPSGEVSGRTAGIFAAVLFMGGLFICLGMNLLCITIAIINVLLLILYAARLKQSLLLGNLTVAYLAGSMFLFGGAFAGPDGLYHILPFAGMTFFAMLSRELIKDAEDVEGDEASGAVTLPVTRGIRVTVLLALLSALLGTAASFVPAFWWGPWYAAGILVVDLVILYGCIRATHCSTPADVRASHASLYLKAGMFSSLVVFVLSALLL